MLQTISPDNTSRMIRFRVEDRISSASVQSDLCNALDKVLQDSGITAQEWLTRAAKTAYKQGMRSGLSAHLTELAYLELMPESVRRSYDPSSPSNKSQISVRLSNNMETSITVPAVLYHYLKESGLLHEVSPLVDRFKHLGVAKISATVRWYFINMLLNQHFH